MLRHAPIIETLWRDAHLAVARVPLHKWYLVAIAVRTVEFGAITEADRSQRSEMVQRSEERLATILVDTETPTPELQETIERLRALYVPEWNEEMRRTFAGAAEDIDAAIVVLHVLA